MSNNESAEDKYSQSSQSSRQDLKVYTSELLIESKKQGAESYASGVLLESPKIPNVEISTSDVHAALNKHDNSVHTSHPKDFPSDITAAVNEIIASIKENEDELGNIDKKTQYAHPYTCCTRLVCAILVVILGISICAFIVLGLVLANDINYWSSLWTQTQCYLSMPPTTVYITATDYYLLYDVAVALNPALADLSPACIRQGCVQNNSDAGDISIQVSPYPLSCWVMTGVQPDDPCLSHPCSDFDDLGCISWYSPPLPATVAPLSYALYGLIPVTVLPTVALIIFCLWHKGFCCLQLRL